MVKVRPRALLLCLQTCCERDNILVCMKCVCLWESVCVHMCASGIWWSSYMRVTIHMTTLNLTMKPVSLWCCIWNWDLTAEEKSTSFPSFQGFPCLDAFVKKITEKATNFRVRGVAPSNFLEEQCLALIELSRLESITIKSSDKPSGKIVVMNNLQYVNMCMRVFVNLKWYMPIAPIIDCQSMQWRYNPYIHLGVFGNKKHKDVNVLYSVQGS